MNLLAQLQTSMRIAFATMVICGVLFPLLILAAGQLFTSATAEGSIIYDAGGKAIGSELIAQKFTRPEYFWPRPSAVDFDGAASGGSNLSPAGEALHRRARERVRGLGRDDQKVIPADLVTTSGSGLDPHITLAAALFQADRVAMARGLNRAVIEKAIQRHTLRSGWGMIDKPLVNVLRVNLDLDGLSREAVTGQEWGIHEHD